MADVTGGSQLIARLHAMQTTPPLLLRRLAAATIAESKRLAPRRTANLSRSIVLQSIDDRQAVIVASAGYAAFVEYGTGLYGPRHRRITPVAAKALRWVGGNAGAIRLTGSRRSGKAGLGAGFIFRRSTRGMRPEPFMAPGVRAALASFDLAADVVAAWNGAG